MPKSKAKEDKAEATAQMAHHHRKRAFPTFAVVVLVLAVLWLLSDLKIMTVDVPWIPLILIIVAIGWIVNSRSKQV